MEWNMVSQYGNNCVYSLLATIVKLHTTIKITSLQVWHEEKGNFFSPSTFFPCYFYILT